MKILILSPLFPPDTGAPAAYMKTLLPQLSEHEVTLVLYGYLPESTAQAETIILDKRWSKSRLLIQSTLTLRRLGKQSDLIIINNGPSTELPALVASFFLKTPMTLCVSDPLAAAASTHGVYRFIHQLSVRRMKHVLTLPEDEKKYLKAEILPFTPFDEEAERLRLDWWKKHISELISL